MNKISFFLSAESWLDKTVRNPSTGNMVKIKSLPKDQREKYNPHKTTPEHIETLSNLVEGDHPKHHGSVAKMIAHHLSTHPAFKDVTHSSYTGGHNNNVKYDHGLQLQKIVEGYNKHSSHGKVNSNEVFKELSKKRYNTENYEHPGNDFSYAGTQYFKS